MDWYIKITFYFFGLLISFYTLSFVDFNKFIRIGKKQYAILTYATLSIAIGYLIGKLLIEIASLAY